jgi:LPS-assembly lipoprotein
LNKFTRWFSILLLAMLLAGCGFQLRGSTPETRLGFESLYLDAPVGTPLERDLRTVLRASSTQLTADAKSAPVTLRVLSQDQEKKVLTLNAQGKVREFSLTYRVRFEVADASNKKLLQPPEIALQSILSYSEEQALAKEQEERMTFEDLRRDAVAQIMRQLARVKPEQL